MFLVNIITSIVLFLSYLLLRDYIYPQKYAIIAGAVIAVIVSMFLPKIISLHKKGIKKY